LEDPRTGNAGRHDLLEMLMIALCTVVSGGEDCTDMAEFARTKLEFLRGFLKILCRRDGRRCYHLGFDLANSA